MRHGLVWLFVGVLFGHVGGCGYETHGARLGASDDGTEDRYVTADGGVPSELGSGSSSDPSVPGGGDSVGGHGDGAGQPEDRTETHHPALGVLATIAAWRERYFVRGDVSSPDLVSCIGYIANLEIVVPDHDEFRRLCQRCDPDDPDPVCDRIGRVNACAPWGALRGEDGDPGAPHALNVIAEVRAQDPVAFDHLVIHETIHHLGECSGDGNDRHHERTALWCTSDRHCGDDSARSINTRARELLEVWRTTRAF